MEMTQTQHIINAVLRAQNEEMIVVKSGAPESKNYIVVHDNKGYEVFVHGRHITRCTCPHNTYRSVVCKHMVKVALEERLEIAGFDLNVPQLEIV